MIRLTKLTDYGLVVLTHFATHPDRKILNARDIAEAVELPLPTVSKLLKTFARNGLLSAHRGVHGGYSLTRAPEKIYLPEIIEIFEGPIAVSECQEGGDFYCLLKKKCPLRTRWRPINEAVRAALSNVTLAEMAGGVSAPDSGSASVCGNSKQGLGVTPVGSTYHGPAFAKKQGVPRRET